MYLLNNIEIRNSVLQNNQSYLTISNFENECLQHTFYYYRVGGIFSAENDSPLLVSDRVSLQPDSYVIIESLETFYLGDKIFGIIGQSTDLIRSGLQLVYSPFIDPLFRGKLSFGLKNLSQNNIDLTIGQIIGKVSFFDVSDSLPIQLDIGSMIEGKFKKKFPLRDDDPIHSDPEDE